MTTQDETEIAYEVEIRFCADSVAEAFETLPFLETTLGSEKTWQTSILGRELYERGELLRIGYVPPQVAPGETQRVFLGYKGPDVGQFANIRQEWGEEVTGGIAESAIFARLGLPTTYADPAAVFAALTAAGYTAFMDFSGVDRLGYMPSLDVHTKLMRCPKILGDKVMVELELATTSHEDALQAQAKLQTIAADYGITDRLIREEPPTLLYQVAFPG